MVSWISAAAPIGGRNTKGTPVLKAKQRLQVKKSKITVHEVAAHAGDSESTVSRVMRNAGLVAEAARAKVMESVRAGVCAQPHRRVFGLDGFKTA